MLIDRLSRLIHSLEGTLGKPKDLPSDDDYIAGVEAGVRAERRDIVEKLKFISRAEDDPGQRGRQGDPADAGERRDHDRSPR